MAKSSIHIENGNAGFLAHNDRSKETVNSIFKHNKNEVWNNKKDAFKIYRFELAARSDAYTKRTKQKLQKKTTTHLSAIVNLNVNHNLDDVKKVASLLEHELDTKVFQIALHRDEGHINDEGEEIVNYHAHIEFLGLDQEGRSIRQKLKRKTLMDLQSDTAMVLNMERGTNYVKEQMPRPKRLDTYEYKAHKKEEAKTVKAKQNELKAEAKKALEAKEQEVFNDVRPYVQGKNKEIEEKNVTIKSLKAEVAILKAELQEAGAKRPEYAKMEALAKELTAKVKAKDLTLSELQTQIDDFRESLASANDEISTLKAENQALKHKIANLPSQDTFEELKTENEQLKKMVYSDILENYVNDANEWDVEQVSYQELYERLEIITEKMKEQLEYFGVSVKDLEEAEEEQTYDNFLHP